MSEPLYAVSNTLDDGGVLGYAHLDCAREYVEATEAPDRPLSITGPKTPPAGEPSVCYMCAERCKHCDEHLTQDEAGVWIHADGRRDPANCRFGAAEPRMD